MIVVCGIEGLCKELVFDYLFSGEIQVFLEFDPLVSCQRVGSLTSGFLEAERSRQEALLFSSLRNRASLFSASWRMNIGVKTTRYLESAFTLCDWLDKNSRTVVRKSDRLCK